MPSTTQNAMRGNPSKLATWIDNTMIKTRKSITAIVVFALILPLSGCVWLRLLELKSQLGEFDKNFASKVDENGYTLSFKQPVIFAEDLSYLSKLQPSWKETRSDGQRWFYNFKKIDASGRFVSPRVSIVHQLGFSNNQLLNTWIFPPNLLAMTPAPFLELSLRGLGFSKIFKSKRQVKATFDKLPKVQAPIPTKENVISVLGDPIEIQQQEYGSLYIYHFQLDTDSVEEGYEDRKFMEFKLGFAADNEVLLKLWSKFMGMNISLDYTKLSAKQSP